MFRHGTLRIIVLGGLAALASACASTGAVPQPFPKPIGVRPQPTDPAGGDPNGVRPHPPRPAAADPIGVRPHTIDGYAIAGTALSLRGSPYRNGGSDPTGFDCSGLVWYVFAQHGISVPRTVSQQFSAGSDVTTSELRAGDLVFFSTDAPGASHVGMLIGGDEFVHAPSARGDVRVERINTRYWLSRYIGARRMN